MNYLGKIKNLLHKYYAEGGTNISSKKKKKGDEMENDDGDNECGGVCYYYPKLDL